MRLPSATARTGWLVPALCIFLYGWDLGATSVRQLQLDELVRGSSVIVQGTVEDVRSYLIPERGWVATDTRIRVTDTLKGSPGGYVTVTELGGVVGDTGMLVAGAAQFRRGEETIVFLRRVDGKWRTLGLSQGKFEVRTENGEKTAVTRISLGEGGNRIRVKDLARRVRQSGAQQ